MSVDLLEKKSEPIRWRAHATVEKWAPVDIARARILSGKQNPDGDTMHRLGFVPESVEDFPDNLVTTAGLNRVTSLIIGAGGQAATNTASRLGVGDSNTAATVGQTDLQGVAGSTHRQFKVMDATYPQQSNGVITFKSTFGTAEANFAWAEWCVDIGTPTVADGTTVNALMLNRKVAAMGTKASGASWTLTVTITLA